MSNFKATYFWQSPDNEGWSESFYWVGADYDAATTAADALVDPLLALRDTTFKMIWARISNTSIRGDSVQLDHAYPLAGTYAPAGMTLPQPANVALLVGLVAGPSLKNHWFLRGLDQEIFKGRELIDPLPANFLTAFAAVKAILEAASGWSTRNKSGSGTTYTAITKASLERVTDRRVGRPFASPRGRVKA